MADKSCRLPRRARVLRNTRLCVTGTFLLRFEVADGEPFEFEPGQFVAIDCEHPTLGYRRSPYCIASPPNSSGVFELLVREVPEGPVSVFLSRLEPSDLVSFRGPAGAVLPLPPDSREIVLIATGVGLSPFLPLLARVAQTDPFHRVSLYWGLRLEEDICLLDILEGWTRRLGQFSYEVSLSRPPGNWTGLRGRVTESVPPRLLSLGDKQFYLCGNGAMIVELTEALALAGVPRSRIYDEPFFNLRHRAERSLVRRLRDRIPATDISAPYERLQQLLEQRR